VPPLIYDCFTFFNEMELLELRLRILEDVVDRFVVVEADVTFQGAKKPLHYRANAARYARWADKIIYVPVTDMPDSETAWDREHHQRRAIERGLDGAAEDDLVVVTDVDEIPRPEVLLRLARESIGAVALRMDMYYYFANVLYSRTWDAAKAVRRRDFEDAQSLRSARGLPIVERAGWHFSYFADRDSIRHKMASFSHIEYANDRWMSSAHIERSMRFGIRLFGGWTEIVPSTDLPPALTNDPRYANYFHRGLTPFEAVLARAYRLTTSCRDVLPNSLTDGHPAIAFFVAAPIAGARWARRQASWAYRKTRSKLGRARRSAVERLRDLRPATLHDGDLPDGTGCNGDPAAPG
jgi:beta-1,4-mannosyl-glycoprotein beta-1,4-N-acetylglucosaminyltransferase